MKIRMQVATLAMVLFAATSAQAETIVEYQTAGGVNPLAASIVNPAVSADGLTGGSGLGLQFFSTFNFNDWDTASTSFADAVAANDFYSWGFDVTAPGTTIDLTNLSSRWDRSGTGPDDFEIQVSVNGAPGITVLTYDYGDSTSGVDFPSVDLSAVPTVSTGDSVVFTLGAFNSESAGGTFDLESIDFNGPDQHGIRIEGTVTVIPEPASLGLLACGLAAIGFRRVRS